MLQKTKHSSIKTICQIGKFKRSEGNVIYTAWGDRTLKVWRELQEECQKNLTS